MSEWIKYDGCPHPYCVEGSVKRYDKQTTDSYGQVIVELSEVTEQCPVCLMRHELEQARAEIERLKLALAGSRLFEMNLETKCKCGGDVEYPKNDRWGICSKCHVVFPPPEQGNATLKAALRHAEAKLAKAMGLLELAKDDVHSMSCKSWKWDHEEWTHSPLCEEITELIDEFEVWRGHRSS